MPIDEEFADFFAPAGTAVDEPEDEFADFFALSPEPTPLPGQGFTELQPGMYGGLIPQGAEPRPAPLEQQVDNLAEWITDPEYGDFYAEFAAKRTPENLRPQLQAAVQQAAARRQVQEPRTFPGAMAEAGKRGLKGIPRNIAKLFYGTELSAEEMRYRDGLIGVRETEHPLVDPEDPFYKRWPIGAAEIAPPMAAGIAAGAATGGVAAGTAVGSAFWFTQIYPDEFEALRKEGYSETHARRAALPSALAQAALENYIKFNPLGVGKEVLKRATRQSTFEWLKQGFKKFGLNFLLEWGEEPAQAATSELARHVAGAVNDKVPDRDITDSFMRTWDATAESFGPLLVLMGAGHAAGAAGQVGQRPSKPPLLDPAEAATIAREEPERAQAILEAGTSRKLGELVPGAAKGSKGQREELQQFMRMAVEQQAQVTEPPVEAAPAGELSAEVAARPVAQAPRAPEGPPQPPTGVEAAPEPAPEARRLKLAIPVEPDPIRAMFRKQDEAREAAGIPTTLHDVDVATEAEARVAADPQAVKQAILDQHHAGRSLDPYEAVAGHRLAVEEGFAAIEANDSEKMVEVAELIDAYRGTKTTTARVLRLGRDPREPPEKMRGRRLVEEVLTPGPKEQQQIENAIDKGDFDEANRIRRLWAADINRIRKILKAQGLDLNRLSEYARDPVVAVQALRKMQTARAAETGWAPAFREWFTTALLWGPPTWVVNAVGNAGYGFYHYTVERSSQALLNTVVRDPRAARVGHLDYLLKAVAPALTKEGRAFQKVLRQSLPPIPRDKAGLRRLRDVLAGAFPGIAHGARNFIRAMQVGEPVLEMQHGLRPTEKYMEGRKAAIKGKLGEAVRWPYRFLGAGDDFFGSLYTTIELPIQAEQIALEEKAAQAAARIAQGEGLKDTEAVKERIEALVTDKNSRAWEAAQNFNGPELRQRIAELVLDPYSEAWTRAIEVARELTFKKRGARLQETLMRIKQRHPNSTYIMPFLLTPYNIFAAGGRRTAPWAVPTTMSELRRAMATGDYRKAIPQMAEGLLALAVILVLLDNDPEDPWITGSLPEFRRETRAEAQRTFHPQSVKIGGQWWSYSRVEPFATTLGMTIDWINAIRSGSPERMAKDPLKSLFGQINNKTFLTGISDLLQVVTADEPAEAAARWASNFGAAWMPNIVRTVGRAGREHYPYRGVWGEGVDWVERLLKRTVQKTEVAGWIVKDEPAIDPWGRKRPTSGPFNKPGSDFVWRLLSPIRVHDEDVVVGDRVILNWNLQQSDDKFISPIHVPAKSYKHPKTKKMTYMTPEQYTQFLTLSGHLARYIVDNTRGLNADNPRQRDVDFVKKTMTRSRSRVKKALIREWQGGSPVALPELVQEYNAAHPPK